MGSARLQGRKRRGDTRGFNLVSRHLRTDDSHEQIDSSFIEVKGRAGAGEIALTANEYEAALSLGDEYWLYIVFDCASDLQATAHPESRQARVGSIIKD